MPAFSRLLLWFQPVARRLLLLGTVAAAYGALAWLCFLAAARHPVVSAIWLPSGFALFIVLRYGHQTWPGIAVGAFLANLAGGVPLPGPAFIAVGNTLEAVLGAALLRRVGFQLDLSRLRDVAALLGIAAVTAPVVSATIGIGSLVGTGSALLEVAPRLWAIWWSGDALGILLLTPLLLLWVPSSELPEWPGLPPNRLVDGIFLLGALAILTWAVFGRGIGHMYLLFPIAMLAAWRLGPRGAVLAIALVASVAIELTLEGLRPHAAAQAGGGLLSLQIFLVFFAISTLTFAVAVAQQERSEIALLGKTRQLASAQELAQMGSWTWQIATDRVTWSGGLSRIFGQPDTGEDGFFGTVNDFLDRVHPDDRITVQETLRRALETRTGFKSQERILRPDGEIRVLASIGEVVCNAKGSPVSMRGVCQDITESWRAEAARRETEGLLRAVFERSTVGMAILAPSGQLKQGNPAFLQLLGRNDEAAPSIDLIQATNPEDRPALQSALENLIAGRSAVVELELRHTAPEEEPVWARHSLSALPVLEGSAPLLVSVVVDITQRKRAEVRLEQALTDVRQLVESANAILWRGDPASLAFTFVSHEAESLLGYPARRWVWDASFWRSRVHPEDLEQAVGFYSRLVKEPGVHRHEYRMIAQDGRVVCLRDQVRVVSRDGIPFEMVGVMTDVTEERRAEALVHSLHRTTEMLTATLDLDRILDVLVEQGALLLEAEGGMAGIRNSEGMTVQRIYRRRTWMPLERTWPPGFGFPGWALAQRTSVLTNEAERDSRMDGVLREAAAVRSALSAPVFDATGKVIAFVELHNKIVGGFTVLDRELLESLAQAAALAIQNAFAYREQIATRARVQALSRQLMTAQENERRRVAREIHDELGQTLVGLRMGLENLRLDLPAQGAGEARKRVGGLLETMQESMKQVQRLVLGLRPAILDNLGLGPALEWAGEEFSRQTGIACSLDLPKLPERLDPELAAVVFRVAQEALTNVARHAQARQVRVAFHRTEEGLKLEVRDDGRGVRPSDLEKAGSLGVTGMRERAAAVGGTLEVSSNGDQGTTVTLRVPLSPLVSTESA